MTKPKQHRACTVCDAPFILRPGSSARQCSTFCRFVAKVGEPLPNGCIEWQAGVNASGYGLFRVSNGASMQLAHRFAYESFIGPIPDGLNCLHRCDNPRCVNAGEHLFLGTDKDNSDDKMSKGRHGCPRGDAHPFRKNPTLVARGARHGSAICPERVLRGEKHPRSKFTNEQITDMRIRRDSGETTIALAAAFGTSTANVSAICRRKAWAHI